MRSGVQLGPYAIMSRLGAGGMGEVYRATDTRLDRTVAVKILKPEKSQDAKGIQRFQRLRLSGRGDAFHGGVWRALPRQPLAGLRIERIG